MKIYMLMKDICTCASLILTINLILNENKYAYRIAQMMSTR